MGCTQISARRNGVSDNREKHRIWHHLFSGPGCWESWRVHTNLNLFCWKQSLTVNGFRSNHPDCRLDSNFVFLNCADAVEVASISGSVEGDLVAKKTDCDGSAI